MSSPARKRQRTIEEDPDSSFDENDDCSPTAIDEQVRRVNLAVISDCSSPIGGKASKEDMDSNDSEEDDNCSGAIAEHVQRVRSAVVSDCSSPLGEKVLKEDTDSNSEEDDECSSRAVAEHAQRVRSAVVSDCSSPIREKILKDEDTDSSTEEDENGSLREISKHVQRVSSALLDCSSPIRGEILNEVTVFTDMDESSVQRGDSYLSLYDRNEDSLLARVEKFKALDGELSEDNQDANESGSDQDVETEKDMDTTENFLTNEETLNELDERISILIKEQTRQLNMPKSCYFSPASESQLSQSPTKKFACDSSNRLDEPAGRNSSTPLKEGEDPLLNDLHVPFSPIIDMESMQFLRADEDSLDSSCSGRESSNDLSTDEVERVVGMPVHIINSESEEDAASGEDEVYEIRLPARRKVSALEQALAWKEEPLFEGSELSVIDGVLEVMDLHLRNRESKMSLDRIIKSISKMLPRDHMLPKSAHIMLTFIEELSPPALESSHYFCKSCMGSCAENEVCQVCETKTDLGHFYNFDIEDIIRYWFEHKNLAALIDETMAVCGDGTLRDIQDGEVYSSMNVSRKPYDVNLVLSTDGVRIRKGSNKELWLLLATPVEVPIHLRESFITILGVWYDEVKPKNMNVFFKPFCETVNLLNENNGLEWKHPNTKEIHKSCVMVPLVVADAPARAKVLNMKAFNSINGCNTCEISAKKSAPLPRKKRIRVYKYENEPRLRDKLRMHRQAAEACQNRRVVKGVIGPSILSTIPSADVSTCAIPEYMHSVLLGVTKQLLTLWTSKPGPWNIKHFIPDLDILLNGIKHPSFVHRARRKLEKLASWKASDFYYFLLFEALIVLPNYLPDLYCQHLMLLVRSIFSLLKRGISQADIDEAHLLLKFFVFKFQQLYGDRAMTYNVHQLCHLALCVRRFGPLSGNSAFPFEGLNGIVAKATHGTNHVGAEIVNNIKIFQGVQRLTNIARGLDSNSPSSPYCQGQVLGLPIQYEFSPEDTCFFDGDTVKIFTRAKIGYDIYTSEAHKVLKSSNLNVMYQQNGLTEYSSIKYFVERNGEFCVCLRQYAVDHLSVLFNRETFKTISHLIPVTDTNNSLIVSGLDILSTFEKVGKVKNFIFKRPNRLHTVM